MVIAGPRQSVASGHAHLVLQLRPSIANVHELLDLRILPVVEGQVLDLRDVRAEAAVDLRAHAAQEYPEVV